MTFDSAIQKLRLIDQEDLLEGWERLSANQQEHLLKQIASIDTEILKKQKALLVTKESPSLDSYEMFTDFYERDGKEEYERGLDLIAAGKVACLLLAGGQGSRLGLEGPKGIYPISPIKKKSLFQLFAEKVRAASRQVGRPLMLAIMTSPLNHNETVAFFEKHDYFGLQMEQLFFYSQSTLPFLSSSGKLFLESPDAIAAGPDGNGAALHQLVQAGIWSKWRQAGVEYINFILIDNPLADPFDAHLLGFHKQFGNEITAKCVRREEESEKVGLFVNQENRLAVVEYSELPETERLARTSRGEFKHSLANTSLFCFSASFVDNLSALNGPLHKAWKSAKNGIKAWKFERFIFDLLPRSQKVKALVYPRSECFAPLKNSLGSQDPTSVQQALQQMDRVAFSKIAEVIPPERPFELAQDFYYPSASQRAYWHKKALPNLDYIDILVD